MCRTLCHTYAVEAPSCQPGGELLAGSASHYSLCPRIRLCAKFSFANWIAHMASPQLLISKGSAGEIACPHTIDVRPKKYLINS